MNHDNTKISFEALLQMAVTEADQRDLARLPSNQEMNDAFQPSQRLEKKVKKTLHQRQTARRRRTALRWARNAAVVVLGIWVVFTGALVPVQAVQGRGGAGHLGGVYRGTGAGTGRTAGGLFHVAGVERRIHLAVCLL